MWKINHKRTQKKSEPAPDEIRTHDPPCSRSDALTSELLRTRWRARVIFVGWTCELHLAVIQSITSNTLLANESSVAQRLEHPIYNTEGRGFESHLGLRFFSVSSYGWFFTSTFISFLILISVAYV